LFLNNPKQYKSNNDVENKKKLKQIVTFYDIREDIKRIIFLLHGNSLNASLFMWMADSDLFSEYRIISIDLPGHGKSAKSDNPEKRV